MAYTEFMKHLDSSDLAPLYLFYGAEDYLITHSLNVLEEKIISPEYKDFNWIILDGQTCEVYDILKGVETLPFFGEKKVVIIKNAPFFCARKNRLDEKTEQLFKSYFENPLSTTVLIFWATDKPDKRKSLYKQFKKRGAAIEFDALDAKTFPRWIKKILKEKGKSIDEGTLSFLVEQTGYLAYKSEKNLYDVLNLLNQLIGFLGNQEVVNQGDIQSIWAPPLEKSIFDMVDALGKKRAEEALRIVQKLFEKGEPAVKIMAMVTRHFRLLLKTKVYEKKGYSPSVMATKLKVPPFAVRNQLFQIKKISEKKLIWALRRCLQTEYAMKTGRKDGHLALETLMVELSTDDQGE